MHPDTKTILSVITEALEWATAEINARGFRGVESRPQNVGPFALFVAAHHVDRHRWVNVSIQHHSTQTLMFFDSMLPSEQRQVVSDALYAVSVPVNGTAP